MHAELFDELAQKGFVVHPGDLGENITTRGIELLQLTTGTQLQIGADALIEVTGLRNPCNQIEAFMPGLLSAVLEKTDQGLVRKAGVMAIVLEGGLVKPTDQISVEKEGHGKLERV